MSLQNIPTIPGVDASAVKALTRLCSGEEGTGQPEKERPHLVDIGDDIYLMFTDGSTAILLLLEVEDGLPDPAEVPSNPEVSGRLGALMARVSGDHATYYENTDVAKVLTWCAEGTTLCPKCKGTKLCMFARHNTTAGARENPDALAIHEGSIGGVRVDRRRLQVPLQLLGVDEGEADLVVSSWPTESAETADGERVPGPASVVALVGENWRIYTAGLALRSDREQPVVPTFDL